jgi:hypothetical protein
MTRRRMKRLRGMAAGAAVVVALGAPRPAFAIFGEEDWISGQNQTLIAMLSTELEATTNLAQIITIVRNAAKAANDTLALARTVKRVYEVIRHYDLKDLQRDALQGFYTAIPEARQLDGEIRELVGNGRALVHGDGVFWSQITSSDAEVSARARALFEHGYKAALWPMVLGGMKASAAPTPVERAIQARYRRSGELAQQALEKSSYGVLAEKVKTFVEDAESKDQVDLKMAATQAQLQLQTAQDTTELLRLERIEAAEQETLRRGAAAFSRKLGQGLSKGAQTLVAPGGRP